MGDPGFDGIAGICLALVTEPFSKEVDVPAKIRGLLQGPKIRSNHSTVIEASKPLIRVAKDLDIVTKVVVGEIVSVGPGIQRIKFVEVPAGLKVTVRGGMLQQLLFLYTTDRQAVRETIERTWLEAKS